MDSHVKSNISLMIESLQNNDKTKAQFVIANDKNVNKLETSIENYCFQLLIQHQPVATDFREITAILKIITHLERISDYCAWVCEHFLMLPANVNCDCIFKLIKLSLNSKLMFNEMVEGFLNNDDELISDANRKDSISNNLFKDLEKIIISNFEEIGIENALCLILMGRSLERLSDHITNVCDWIHFKIHGNHDEY